MTINVETDHPHGVAHVALFTCQHRPDGRSATSISVQPDRVRQYSGRHSATPRPQPYTQHHESLRSRLDVGVGSLVTLDISLDTDLDGVQHPPTLVVEALCALA